MVLNYVNSCNYNVHASACTFVAIQWKEWHWNDSYCKHEWMKMILCKYISVSMSFRSWLLNAYFFLHSSFNGHYFQYQQIIMKWIMQLSKNWFELCYSVISKSIGSIAVVWNKYEEVKALYVTSYDDSKVKEGFMRAGHLSTYTWAHAIKVDL